MTWYDCYFKGGVPGSLYVDISVDGGQTFGADKKVANFLAPPLYTSDCTGFKAKCFPSAAADPNDPSKLYITYISDPDGYMDIRIDTGDDPGGTYSNYPVITRDGNYIFAAWQDARTGGPSGDVFFNRSTDNGQTWGVSAVGPLDNTDTPGASNSLWIRISSSGPYVYVVWEDYRAAGGVTDVYFNRSTDYGVTWQTEQNLSQYASAHSGAPYVTSIGNYVYVAWNDLRNGSYDDIYINVSSSNGSSWSGPIRVDNGDTPGASLSRDARISCTGSNVYCMWVDDRTGGYQPHFNYSTNYGLNWQSSSTMLSAGTATWTNMPLRDGLECSGNFVYACWLDDRSGVNEIYFNRSATAGVNWAGEAKISDADSVCGDLSMDIQGNNVYIGWTDNRMTGAPGGYDVFFDYSTNNGASWQASDIGPIDVGGIGIFALALRIKSDANNVYATWIDQRFGPGNDQLFFSRSTNNGATWLAETHINVGTQPFGLSWNIPDMVAENGWVNIACPDARCIYMGMGQQDILSNYSTDYGATWLNGLDEADVYCVRSTDAGTTWQSPVTVSDNPAKLPDLLPWVAVKSNGMVDIAYYQSLIHPMNPLEPAAETRMAVSSDAGASFGASFLIQDMVIPPLTNWIGEYIGIAVMDSFAYTVFTDLQQTGNSDIFIDRVVNPTVSSVCGDADASGDVDIDDVVYLIAYIFSGGPPPSPLLSGDAECSGDIDIDDVVYLIAYIFSGGNWPCDPDGDGIPDC